MPGTIKNTDDIRASIQNLRNTADMLQAVLDGESKFTEMAQQTGTTPQKINQNLRKHFTPYIKARVLSIENLCEMLEACRTPGDRFLLAIFGEDEYDPRDRPENQITLLPDYDDDALWDTAHEAMTSREYEIVTYLYSAGPENKTPVADIAKRFSVTRERIYQLRRKAIRKMRRPQVLRKIFPAMTAIAIDTMDVTKRNTKAAMETYAQTLRESKTAEIIGQLTEQYMANGHGEPGTIQEFLKVLGWTPEEDVGPVKIQDTDMTARTYHALHRAGITTLDQIAAMHVEDIKRIRNLGANSMDELGRLLLKHLNINRPELMKPKETRTK